MPKDNKLVEEIPSLYKRQTVHVLIFGFMQGVTWAQPSISKKEAAKAFIRRYAEHVADIEEKDIIQIYDSVNRDILHKS